MSIILGGVHDGVKCLPSGVLDLDNEGVQSRECLLLHSLVRFGEGDLERCLLRLLCFFALPFDRSRDFFRLSRLRERLRFLALERDRLRSGDLDFERDRDRRVFERLLFFRPLDSDLLLERDRRLDADRRLVDLLPLDNDLLGRLGVRVLERDRVLLISRPNLSFNRRGFSAIKARTS